MKVGEIVIPENRYYTEEHEWALIEEDGLVRTGITDYAQRELHEIVFVETPARGVRVRRMEPIGTAESVKAVSEFYSPVSGEVVEVNEDLALSPELVNQDPYGKGWIALIRPSKLESELEELMMPEEYRKYVQELLQRRHVL